MKKFLDSIIGLILNLIWFFTWLYVLAISTDIPVRISNSQFIYSIIFMVGFLVLISIYILKYCKTPRLTFWLVAPQIVLWAILFKNDSLLLIQTPSDVLNSNIAATGLICSFVIEFFASRRTIVLKKAKKRDKLNSIKYNRIQVVKESDLSTNKKAS